MCRTASFVEKCQRASEGTTNRVRLQENKFLALEIPLPPLAEQQRVVARIEELAAQIHEARTLRRQAAEEAEALIASARSRFFSVNDECPGLAEVCRDVTDGTHDTPRYVDEGIPFLTGKDISPLGLNFDDARFISEEDHRRFSQHCPVEIGDVLLTLIGTIDKVAIVDTDRPFSIKNVGLLKPDKGRLDSRYLFNYLQSSPFQEQAVSYAKRTAQAFVGLKKLRIVKIPVPPLPEQCRIVAELDALQAEVDALKRLQAETSAELDALIPSILDRAFNGSL
jgi:type I restriction enzyme S subunit